MTSRNDAWKHIHRRLRGVIPPAATVPAKVRVAKNAYWYLAGTAGVEPAGFGDVSGTDLLAIASELTDLEMFVPIREHFALTLAGGGIGGARPPLAPEPGAIVGGVDWLVAYRHVYRVSPTAPGHESSVPLPGDSGRVPQISHAEVIHAIESLRYDIVAETADPPADVDAGDLPAGAVVTTRVLAVARGEEHSRVLTPPERLAAHAILDARMPRRAGRRRFGDRPPGDAPTS